jgi:Zn-dependent alcohol dehydrogenase
MKCGQCFTCVRGQSPCEVGGPVALAGTMFDGSVRLHDGDQPVHHIFCQSSFADYTVVPAVAAIPIRKDAPLDKMASLGCGVGTGLGAAINRAKVTPGSTAMVIGAGGVGLAAMMGARLVGAANVIAVDISDAKLAKAKQIAADTGINSSEVDLAEAIAETTGGRGVDYAIDCVGVNGTLESAFAATRFGGTVVAVGIMNVNITVTVDLLSLVLEKNLTGSYAGSLSPLRDIPAFVDLYMAGKLDIGSLIDREGRLADVASVLEELENGKLTKGVIIH